jgi:peptide deformylase
MLDYSAKKLTILEWPNEILESRAKEIIEFADDLKKIAADMHHTMKASNGIGLAANQVGILQRILTIEIPYSKHDQEEEVEKKWWHNKPLTIINPKITNFSTNKSRFYEGCLSFPKVYDYVARYDEITVEYQNLEGKIEVIHADKLFSCCLQHEIDHLDGIVFFKKMSRIKARRIRAEMQKKRKISLP